ncbi:MAG: energy transducer TonB [Bradyrhizobium sp.]|nr:energy transducer TonB [Bradyrhizobium sp.]
MNAHALYEAPEQATMRRWGACALTILAAHALVIALGMSWRRAVPDPGVSAPAIMVDLAPVTSAPQSMPVDIAPGPLMEEADASPPEPARQERVEEQLAPTPPQQKPEVVAPPEQRLPPTPDKPEPAKVVPELKPTPVKPKVVRPDAKKPLDATPAPRTSAPPRAERQAPLASAASTGATASALASYNQRVRAHLMRLHRYPAGGNGQRSSVTVAFTVNRSGNVVSSHVAGSTGVAAFDAHAASIVRQAQPFPPIPAEIPQGTISFTIPLRFDPGR